MIRIVIVDDEQYILDFLLNEIEWKSFNMEVIGSFSSSLNALEFIKQNEPDLVITDMIMPQMDGNELIAEINRYSLKVSFIVLSSYSDFKVVRDAFRNGAVDYVLKDNLNKGQLLPLLHEYHKNYSTNINEAFKEYFKLNYWDELEISDKHKFNVLSLYFTRKTNNVPYQKIGTQLAALNQGFIGLKWKGCYFVVGYWIDGLDQQQFSLVEQVRKRINALLPDQLDTFLLGMSRVDGFDHLNELCIEAMCALNRKFYNPNTLLFDSVLSNKKEITAFSFESYQKKMKTAIQQFDFFGVLTIFTDFLNWEKQHEIEELRAKEFITDLMIYFNNQLDHEIIPTLLKNDEISRAIHSLQKFSDLQNWIFTQVKGVEKQYFTSLNTNNFIRLVKMYIDQNFHLELRREDIAKKFSVSKGYLSNRFSDEMGITLVHYINLLRIEQAKNYLVSSDLNVTEICEKVGFANIEHFSRVFKKYAGVSPLKYRMK